MESMLSSLEGTISPLTEDEKGFLKGGFGEVEAGTNPYRSNGCNNINCDSSNIGCTNRNCGCSGCSITKDS